MKRHKVEGSFTSRSILLAFVESLAIRCKDSESQSSFSRLGTKQSGKDYCQMQCLVQL